MKAKHRQEREYKNFAQRQEPLAHPTHTVATLLSSDALVPIELAVLRVRERKTRVLCGLEGASQKQSA